MPKHAREASLCPLCGQDHSLQSLQLEDKEVFQGEEVSFLASYLYCPKEDCYLENQTQIRANSLAMKDAYRLQKGLLTSDEIVSIRQQYQISQKDLARVLDWGLATITRYENHQVQDRVHDDVLRKIKEDPLWFLELLERAKNLLAQKTFEKYKEAARVQISCKKDFYRRQAIYADYALFQDDRSNGQLSLDLDKVLEMIRRLVSQVKDLSQDKLMLLMWYADHRHYQTHGHAISGLVYLKEPGRVIPEGHADLMKLEGGSFDYLDEEKKTLCSYKTKADYVARTLQLLELETLDQVARDLGHLELDVLIQRMEEEESYSMAEEQQLMTFQGFVAEKT